MKGKLAVALAALALSASAWGQGSFYEGKTVTLVIGASGGSLEIAARIVARHLGKHLPGNPIIIVNNMPGGGGIRAANFLYNVAPKDGSTIALLDRGIATAPLLYGEESQAQFEAVKFNWLGSAMRENGPRRWAYSS